MTMPSVNGSSTAEMEDEWETHEASHYSSPELEDEWETPEAAHFSNPEGYSNPELEWEAEASHYSNPELEREAHEAAHYSNPEFEDEWEAQEAAHYSNPYSNPEFEDEAARHARPAAAPRSHAAPRPQAAPRSHAAARPHAAPRSHAAARPHAGARPGGIARPRGVSAGPPHQRRPTPGIRHVTHQAKRIVPHVVHNVLGSAQQGIPRLRSGAPVRRPGAVAPGYTLWRTGMPRTGYTWRPGMRRLPYPGWRPGMPQPGAAWSGPGTSGPRYAGGVTGPTAPAGVVGPTAPGGPRVLAGRRRVPLSAAARRTTVASLFRQLSALFGEGESEAAGLEAQFFGANEFEGELAAHEAAHEAALTEVLAAEAAHTEDESEAEALLGTSLPITISIMGGRRALRRVTPTLVRGNARLVRTLHRGGPTGRQLLRAVPAIQRRTIASLRAAQGAGRPITPGLVVRVMAGQAARVLGTPPILGPSLVRNTAIRQGTVAPAGWNVRPRRSARF